MYFEIQFNFRRKLLKGFGNFIFPFIFRFREKEILLSKLVISTLAAAGVPTTNISIATTTTINIPKKCSEGNFTNLFLTSYNRFNDHNKTIEFKFELCLTAYQPLWVI